MRETIFAARDLSKSYKSVFALDHVDMAVRQGEVYGFIGENGAGKTTLIRILSGLAFKTSGEFSLFGASDENIRYPQDTSLLNEARENLEEMIDKLHSPADGEKPRTYRKNARKDYLNIAKRKNKTGKKVNIYQRGKVNA